MFKSIAWLIAAILGGYLVLVGLMYLFQSKMIYYPTKNILFTPAQAGLKYEDVEFYAKDGIRLHGWFVPAENARATVLFSHGNAGNISGRIETVSLLHNLNLNVFIYDYRGYGKSEGSPDEEGTYNDILAAWNYLANEREIKPGEIVIMGRSLGGAVAAWLAAEVEAGGVILESTFTSAADLGAELYPIFPVRWLLKHEYATIARLDGIDEPVLIAHSPEDELIPYSHGRKLFEHANEPKYFLETKGPHGGGFMQTGAAYKEAIDDFVTGILKQKE